MPRHRKLIPMPRLIFFYYLGADPGKRADLFYIADSPGAEKEYSDRSQKPPAYHRTVNGREFPHTQQHKVMQQVGTECQSRNLVYPFPDSCRHLVLSQEIAGEYKNSRGLQKSREINIMLKGIHKFI